MHWMVSGRVCIDCSEGSAHIRGVFARAARMAGLHMLTEFVRGLRAHTTNTLPAMAGIGSVVHGNSSVLHPCRAIFHAMSCHALCQEKRAQTRVSVCFEIRNAHKHLTPALGSLSPSYAPLTQSQSQYPAHSPSALASFAAGLASS